MTPVHQRSNAPHLERTPWRDRMIVWPGLWFRTLPFPYLFDRWDIRDPDHGWMGSYVTRRRAERGLAEWVEIKSGV